ncbi:MAG: hypothetical protein ACOX1Y_09960 [Zhaonellaceae bacterium]|jgi:hypothetical protein|nr:hypothetical protein [Clostridia bacterium]
MSFAQFMGFQALHYLSYMFAGFMIGTGEGVLANLAFNFVTFFFPALVIALVIKELANFTLNVLSVSLSFNTMTYLLAYALHIPLPSWKLLVLDYGLVSLLSILGLLAGKRLKNSQPK